MWACHVTYLCGGCGSLSLCGGCGILSLCGGCGGMSVPRHFDRGSGCGMLDQLVFHIIHSSVTSRSLGKWITEVWNFGQVTPIHSSTVACC